MPETIILPENSTKSEKYVALLPQIESLIEGERNLFANLANVSAALKQCFKFWWVGFYLVDKENLDQLVLGPFQGPIACTRIKFGRGVCGSSWKERNTILVPDVDQFPGHIACSSMSKSEIVVPIFHPQDENLVVGVLDVDSEFLQHFDQTDKEHLEKLCEIIRKKCNF